MGLGSAHELARLSLLVALVEGTPCPRCGEPMYRVQELDADHVAIPRALHPGRPLPDALSHARCNRSHGARLGQALHGLVSSGERRRPAVSRGEPVATSREW